VGDFAVRVPVLLVFLKENLTCLPPRTSSVLDANPYFVIFLCCTGNCKKGISKEGNVCARCGVAYL
jgi:hypothetical protein